MMDQSLAACLVSFLSNRTRRRAYCCASPAFSSPPSCARLQPARANVRSFVGTPRTASGRLAATCGPSTIDSDYRGEVHVPLINLGPRKFVIERGMRVAQMLIAPVPEVKIIEVDDLDQTKRGHRGFGHTGH